MLRPAHHLPVEPVGVDNRSGELQLGERRGDDARRQAGAANDLVGAHRRIGNGRVHGREPGVDRLG